jgi:branched-subunit amino acid ABC-type transport system permease component
MKRYVRNRRPQWLFITAFAIAAGCAAFAGVMARLAS